MKIIKQETRNKDGILVNIGWHSSEASCAEERKRLRSMFYKAEFKRHDVEVTPTKVGILKVLNDHCRA